MRTKMRNIFLLFLPLAIVLSITAQAKTSVDLDKIETITLKAQTPTQVQIRVPQTGLLRADLFSKSGNIGPVHFEYHVEETEEGGEELDPIPVGNKVVNKGRYSVNVWAEGGLAGQVQIRFVLDPALDIYEPNNSLAAAKPITLPYLGLIRASAGDEDWFLVDEPKGHVIGVHLRTRSQYTGPEIRFHNAGGELLYQSSKDSWGHRGMRYYLSQGKPVFVRVIDSYSWSSDDVRAFRQLAIEAYPPSSDGANLFVKIDMNPSENSASQIDFISSASGSQIASAVEAQEISEALNEAFGPKKSSSTMTIIISAIGLLIVLGLGWVYSRRQKHSKNISVTTQEEKPKPKNLKS